MSRTLKTVAPLSLNFLSSTVSVSVTGRRMAVFGTLMSEKKRIASGLWGLGAITGLVHQVVLWLSGTASIIQSSFSCCSSFAAFWAKLWGILLCLRATGWTSLFTISFALMNLCLPRPENPLWYSDVSFVTTGSVEGAQAWLAVSLSFSWVAFIRCSSPSSTHVSRLRSGRDLVVPLASRKVAMVLLPVLMLSISASKHPTRGTGSLCANANNQVSVGRTAISFLSELWIFSSLCSSMTLVMEHESASILPFTPLTWTSTVAQLRGQGLSSLTWKAKSESDDSFCSSSWTYFAVDCDFDEESFWNFFLLLHMRAKWRFFEHRPHVFPEAGQVGLGPLWSIPQNWQAPSFLSSRGGLVFHFIFWFLGSLWVNSVNLFLIWCKLLLHILGLAVDIFFVRRCNNCWSAYLFTIASPRSFLSRIVCRILLRIASSGSVNPHLATWRCKRTWYWATDSPSFWCILSNLPRGWPWEWNVCRAWQWFFRIHLTAQLMTV